MSEGDRPRPMSAVAGGEYGGGREREGKVHGRKEGEKRTTGSIESRQRVIYLLTITSNFPKSSDDMAQMADKPSATDANGWITIAQSKWTGIFHHVCP